MLAANQREFHANKKDCLERETGLEFDHSTGSSCGREAEGGVFDVGLVASEGDWHQI